jgi:hypothetical protein
MQNSAASLAVPLNCATEEGCMCVGAESIRSLTVTVTDSLGCMPDRPDSRIILLFLVSYLGIGNVLMESE